jgi:uncharacterized protein (DUF4415 family)
MEEKMFAVVWMWRDGAIRIITARGRGMKKKSGTVRDTDRQVKALIVRGGDRTDWVKAKATTAAEVEGWIHADADDVQDEPDWTGSVMGIPAPKDHINIRIDHDVLEWFKQNGKGYQTLMNNVLRAFVHKRRLGGK